MASIQVSTAAWPIAVVTFDGVVSDAEFDGYLRELTGLYARRERYVAVLDATAAGVPSVAQQRKQGEWMARHEAEIRRYAAGLAFVFSSPVFRFVLSSIFLIQPMPCPYTVRPALDDGVQWARAQLRLAEFSPSARPRTGT